MVFSILKNVIMPVVTCPSCVQFGLFAATAALPICLIERYAYGRILIKYGAVEEYKKFQNKLKKSFVPFSGYVSKELTSYIDRNIAEYLNLPTDHRNLQVKYLLDQRIFNYAMMLPTFMFSVKIFLKSLYIYCPVLDPPYYGTVHFLDYPLLMLMLGGVYEISGTTELAHIAMEQMVFISIAKGLILNYASITLFSYFLKTSMILNRNPINFTKEKHLEKLHEMKNL